MKSLEEVKKFIAKEADNAAIEFHEAIATDENADYGRGFRAGVFFAFLDMQSNIGNDGDPKVEK